MTETQEPPKAGKGRPTPKRSEREAARRKPIVQPRTRDAMKAQRSGAGDLRRRQREAMRTGDERNYPPLAAGPERAAVRDIVDARRPYWQLALPLWLGGLVLTLVPSDPVRALGGFLFPFVIGLLVFDVLASRRSIRKGLKERFPGGTKEPVKGLIWYGTARNMQFRRSRLPRPRTSPGSPKATA